MAKGGSRHAQPATRTTRGEAVAGALALAVVLGAASSASAQPAPAPERPADEAKAPSRRWTKTHDLGLGYRAIVFSTQMSDRYTLHGPTLAYTFFVGRSRGLLFRIEGVNLVAGYMTGSGGEFTGSLGDLYDQRHLGFDSMLMAAKRWPLTPKLTVLAAVGPHLQGFSLIGTRYSPVEDVSIGLGALGQASYPLNGWLSLSVQLTAALDPFDLVDHANPSSWVFPVASSFSVAARH